MRAALKAHRNAAAVRDQQHRDNLQKDASPTQLRKICAAQRETKRFGTSWSITLNPALHLKLN